MLITGNKTSKNIYWKNIIKYSWHNVTWVKCFMKRKNGVTCVWFKGKYCCVDLPKTWNHFKIGVNGKTLCASISSV